MPANAFAQGQLAAESMHKHRTPDWRPPLPQSMRKLLTPSQQSQLTAGGSGMLLYQPTGFRIDGADLTQFFMEAHSNPNVTGLHDIPHGRVIYPEDVTAHSLTKEDESFVSSHVVHHAGIKLNPGTYFVLPKVEDGYHLHLPCTFGRTAPFEVDFAGVFFYFTVRSHPLQTGRHSSPLLL